MPKNARVFSLFLAGAQDVTEEQSVVRQLVEEWNVHHGLSAGAMITVVSWKTNTYPEAGAQPQEVINRQVADDADIVVGVFWTRLGSPTPNADSGTQEEIERSINAGKKVMVYFSDRPVSPSCIDTKQYGKVQGFKATYANRGLYSAYHSIEDFRTNFRSHLAQLMNGLVQKDDPEPLGATNGQDPMIEMAFATRYWVLLLAAVDQMVPVSLKALEDLRRAGRTPESITKPEQVALAGPLIVRGAIIDELVKHKVMKKGAADKMGYEALLREVEKRNPSNTGKNPKKAG